ncbi:MAG: T9SS type A sorting domain-containing protein, partial [Vicingaceae bacterium]
TEINNDYFTIEKSEDAVNYEFVEEIVGAGNSNTFKEYNYIDDSYTSGVIYYRLKQTDFDGEFVYFPPKSVNQEDTSEEFKIISVQPNPFTYKFSINIQSKNEGVAEFTLTDLNGNNIQTSLVGINEGKTEFMYMQGNKLAAGTYVVNLVMRGEKISYKVVKQ